MKRTPRFPPPAVRIPRGFVLILVLAMIVITSLMAARVARRSLHLALEGVTAEQELQTRWARYSLQQVVLGRASEILAAEARRGGEAKPRAALEMTLALAQREYRLVLADEQAKLNLNTVFYEQGKSEVNRVVREATRSGSPLAVAVHPDQDADPERRLPVLDSWGQVFEGGTTSDASELAARLQASTTDITCWGSGRLNVTTAPESALRQICRIAEVSSVADELIRLRATAQGDNGVRALLDRLELNESQRERLEPLLTNQSHCWSLWSRFDKESRDHAELSIRETFDSRDYLSTFVW